MVAPAAISGAVVDALIGWGWLNEAEAADRFSVGRALAAMAEDTAKIADRNIPLSMIATPPRPVPSCPA